MRNYLSLARAVLRYGDHRMDRTGVGTRALFGTSLEYDLQAGFPAMTTKTLMFQQVKAELAAFLRGYTRLSDFHAAGCKIWDNNALAPWWLDTHRIEPDDVDLGPIYGAQWRRWGGKVDQLQQAIDLIRTNPTSRRICVTAWNPSELDQMCLPPCHLYYQFFCAKRDGVDELDIFVVMRSVDVFLGMPFDIASYALLLSIVAQQTGRKPRFLKMMFGDTHIYQNHVGAISLQLERQPQALPALVLSEQATIDNFHPEMAQLVNYRPLGVIKGDLNV